jgi:hypothetical protein
MRRLAASPLMTAALLCMSGGLLYLFFAEAVATFSHKGALPTDPLLLLHAVRDGMLLLEVVLLQLLLGGLWAIHLAAKGTEVWCPLRSFSWIHGVLLAEFVYEMIVLSLELAANLVEMVWHPADALRYLGSAAWLIGIAVLTVVLHHQVIGALSAGRETLRSGIPCTRHLSVFGAVLIFVVSAAALPQPSAWLTAAGEVLLGVVLLKHRNEMYTLTQP